MIETREALAETTPGGERLLAAARAARQRLAQEPVGDDPVMSFAEAAAYARRAGGSRARPAGGWESLTSAEVDVVRLAVGGSRTRPSAGAST
jgi:hypothetical protein